MEELLLLLTPNKEHKNVFPHVPFVRFWNGKSLQDYLVRAKLPKLDKSTMWTMWEENLFGL